MKTSIIEPVIHCKIDVIVGRELELATWYYKHGRKDFLPTGNRAGHVNSVKFRGDIFFVIWVPVDTTPSTLAHEVFHLFMAIIGLMNSTTEVTIKTYDNEDDAYHFGNLFEIVYDAVEKLRAKEFKSNVRKKHDIL